MSETERVRFALAAAAAALGWFMAQTAVRFAAAILPAGIAMPGGQIVAASLSALTLVLALRWTNRAFSPRCAAVLTVGWMLSAPLTLPLRAIRAAFSSGFLPTGSIAAALILILTLRRVHPRIRWWRLWLISAGWVIPRLPAMVWPGLAPGGMALYAALSSAVIFSQLYASGWGSQQFVPFTGRATLRDGLQALFTPRLARSLFSERLAERSVFIPPQMMRTVRVLLIALVTLGGLAFGLVALGSRSLWSLYYIPFFAIFVLPLAIPVIIAAAVFVFSPGLAAGYTALLVLEDTRSQVPQLVRLTGLSEISILWGYVSAAFERLSMLVVISTIVVPLSAGYFALVLVPLSLFAVASPLTILATLLTLAATIVGIAGMNLLGAALGAWLALRWRGASAVAVSALVMVMLVALSLLAFAPVSVLGLHFDWASRLCNALLFAAAPFVLGVELIDDAQRWFDLDTGSASPGW